MTQNEKELAKALLLAYLNDGLPPVPSDPMAADRQNQKIGLVARLLDDITSAMLTRSGQLQRVIRGEHLSDERNRADLRREMAKLDDAIAGRDAYAEWNKKQAEINRQRDEELQRANKRQRENRERAQEQTLRMIGINR